MTALEENRTGAQWTRMPVVSERQGDVVLTPPWAAEDMISHFLDSQPARSSPLSVLDAGRGPNRVFHGRLAARPWIDARWCEINPEWCDPGEAPQDFYAFWDQVDWAMGNPPYSQTRKWFSHSYRIAVNLLYLVPLRNVFSGYGFIREIHGFGGIREIRCYGTGGSLGFPMGNAIGAMHVQRGYRGDTRFSFAQEA
jgi:hypothetical protein